MMTCLKKLLTRRRNGTADTPRCAVAPLREPVFSKFRLTQYFVIFPINPKGIGLSSGNLTVPFEISYLASSSLNISIGFDPG